MDRDVELMLEEAVIVDENIAIPACLVQLQTDEAAVAAPKEGGSVHGRKKTKLRQKMEGHCMLLSDYSADYPTFTAKDFHQVFR